MMDIAHLTEQLNLQPHPEGGYYRETYRSEQTTDHDGEIRSVKTAIYYLLTDDDKSHFHRIKSDELWFFHHGDALDVICIENGKISCKTLGQNLDEGQLLQAVVPAHTWFGAKLKKSKGYALVSCTVAPGFDFADFEMARREDLISEFPQLENEIVELTKDS